MNPLYTFSFHSNGIFYFSFHFFIEIYQHISSTYRTGLLIFVFISSFYILFSYPHIRFSQQVPLYVNRMPDMGFGQWADSLNINWNCIIVLCFRVDFPKVNMARPSLSFVTSIMVLFLFYNHADLSHTSCMSFATFAP